MIVMSKKTEIQNKNKNLWGNWLKSHMLILLLYTENFILKVHWTRKLWSRGCNWTL